MAQASDFDPALIRQLTPDGIAPSSRLYDCAVHVIHCMKHHKIALARHDPIKPVDEATGIYWLPFTQITTKRSWYDGALDGSLHVLAGGDNDKYEALKAAPPYLRSYILEVLRVQLPSDESTYFTRVMFYVRLDPNKKFDCCEETDRLKWTLCWQLAEGLFTEPFWGPEPFEFCRAVMNGTRPMQRFHEYTLEMARSLLPDKGAQSGPERMLASANATRSDVDQLFADYLDHCFPSFSGMSIWSFQLYMAKYGFELDDSRATRLFRAFNNIKCGYISFHELLQGLAAMDPNTEQNEERLRFVFRFYDKNHIGVLSRSDFRKMMRDLNVKDQDNVFEAKVKQVMERFNLYQQGDVPGMKFEHFQSAVASKLIRNAGILCRTAKPIFRLISQTIDQRKWKHRQVEAQANRLSQVVRRKYHEGKCQRCTDGGPPLIVPQLFSMSLSGKMTPIKDIEGIAEELTYKEVEDPAAKKLLAAIRNFAPNKGTVQSPNGVMMNKEDQLVKLVEAVRDETLKLFNNDLGKCDEASSPCFVIGDIHGNLEDLLTMEKHLWNKLPIGPALLFLGDYVDRGQWGVECALYVIALKVLYPHKVTILRGNHEVEDVQRKYSFYGECLQKYPNRGEAIFAMLNQVFARMPVAAVLDDAIYCAHGGIPHLETTLEAIRKMPLDIHGESDSELFWEIVWSDPINEEQYRMTCALLNQEPEEQAGYVRNTKRGAAWFYGEKAVEKFFEKNNLTRMVRAHEVPMNGFTFHFGDRCATIFSCSHYQADNQCAVLFVDQERIRVIRIDTSKNGLPFEQ